MQIFISLTPGFSQGSAGAMNWKTVSTVYIQTVETVQVKHVAPLLTALKCGVNESAPRSYPASVINTTSLDTEPRETANCFPSLDRSKIKMSSDLKFVNCLGGPPSIG